MPGSAGVVVGEQLLGPEGAVTGVVLTFNQHLDPTTAQNVKAYALARRISVSSTDSGSILGGITGFGGGDTTTNSIRVKKVKFVLAVYDDANMTVTLTPEKPFRADKYFRFLRVVGSGPNAILLPGGTPIDGNGDGKPGGDAIIKFSSHRGRHFTYKDADGDRVTLTLSRPGELVVMLRRTGSPNPVVYVEGGDPLLTVLTGTVKKGRHGDGIATLQELAGTSTFQNGLTGNPAFVVQMTQA